MATVPLFVLHNNSRIVSRRRLTLEKLSDFEIRKNCGLNYHNLLDITDISDQVEGKYSTAVLLETKIITYLSYIRSGNFQWSLGTLSGTSQPTVFRIIDSCNSTVIESWKNIIQFPTNVVEINKSKLEFANLRSTRGFPNVLGVVDGTHIAIKRPENEIENRFVNRKKYHSINCQVVVDAKERFLDAVVRWPGSTHDALIWRESYVNSRLYQESVGEGWILGEGLS